MAIYVTSDLHGLPLSKLRQLLKKVHFCGGDWLYILGDVIDRENDGGVEILQWLLVQPNVQLLLGNHEAMLLSCDFLFETVTTESIARLSSEQMDLLMTYTQNGGDVTLTALRELAKESPETVEDILDYLRDAPLYDIVEAGGREFLLVHAGLENFAPDRKLSSYEPDELLWTRPTLDTQYFKNAITVFGHTPTAYYGSAYKGKILRTESWIDIDTGIPSGNPPALLRLDDLKEFYLE